MAAKTDTRISRGYSFTFDEDGEKKRYSDHAKTEGRTLAGLIKYLLKASREGRVTVAPPAPGGLGEAGGA